MEYLVDLFLFSSFSIGVITFIFALALFFKKKSLLERYFLLFLTFFLLVMLIYTLLSYAEQLLIKNNIFFLILQFLSHMCSIGLATFGFLFIHKLVGIVQSKKAHIIFFCIITLIAIIIIIHYIYSYLLNTAILTQTEQRMRSFDIADLFFFPGAFYPIILIFLFAKRIQDKTLLQVCRSFAVFAMVFLPILFLENFDITIRIDFSGQTQLELGLFVLPLFYLILNLILLYYGFKHFIEQRHISPPQIRITDGFIKRYNITSREKDLIEMLIKGLSNKQIGEKLFISTATVRNHLHNIFEKTGAVNRLELVKLCSEN